MALTFDLIYASLKDENAALRKVYTEQQALIQQLLEALVMSQPYVESCANGKRVQGWGEQLDRAQDAINAARSRLEQPCA